MTLSATGALLIVPILMAIAVGCVLLRRAFRRQEILPEEMALAAAWVYAVLGPGNLLLSSDTRIQYLQQFNHS